MIDLSGFTRLELERLCQVQDLLVRDLELELKRRDAMIAQAVGVILKAKAELESPPVLWGYSWPSLFGGYKADRRGQGAGQGA